MHTRMYLPDTKSMVLQTNYGSKQCNTLNINDLGGGITRHVILSHFLQTTCSDAIRGHLMDSLCPVGKDKLYQISM